MSARRPSIEALVLIMLLTLTAANWLLMELGLWHVPLDQRVLGSAILVLALFKVRLIMRHFMEVREAPRVLGWIMDGWLLVVAVSLSLQAWLISAA